MFLPRHDKIESKASASSLRRPAWRSVSASVLVAAALAACGGGNDAAPEAEAGALDTSNIAPTAIAESAVLLADGSYPAEAPINPVDIPPGDGTAATEGIDAMTASTADVDGEGRTAHAMSVSSTAMVPAGTSPGPGSALLGWAAPATKANGSSVGALAGYKIYYGTASGKYSGSVMVSGGTATGGTVSGLASGKWYFSVAAVDSSGYESTIGYELSKTL